MYIFFRIQINLVLNTQNQLNRTIKQLKLIIKLFGENLNTRT